MTSLRIPVEPIEAPTVARPRTISVAPWVPLAWVLLFFASSFRFTGHRDVNAAASGVASLENAIELAIYAVFGVLAGFRLLLRTPRFRPTGVFLLGAFGLLALASAMWSLIPLFTVVRAAQLVVLTLLAAVSAGLWSEGRRSFDRDWRRIWTVFLFFVFLFSVAGVIWPNWQNGRFSWPYLHTGTTSEYLAVASLVALSMLFERGWGLRRWAMRLIPIYLAGSLTLLVLTITRSALFGFLVGAVALVATASRLRSEVRLLVVAGLATLGIAAFAWFSEPLLAYVMRSQSADQFFTFTGRTELWAFALDEIQRSPLLGFGFGAARVLLIDRFFWAGTGHNLWIEAALSVGFIGAAVLTALLLWALGRSLLLQRSAPGPASNLGVGFITATLVIGFASTSLALPGLPFAVMGLVVAALSVEHLEPVLTTATPADAPIPVTAPQSH
jgi:exopolysaccharide production protein ExoQ